MVGYRSNDRRGKDVYTEIITQPTSGGSGWTKVVNAGGTSGQFFYSGNFLNGNYFFSGMTDSLCIVKTNPSGTVLSPFPKKYQDPFWKGSSFPSSIVTSDLNIVTATLIYDVSNNRRMGIVKIADDGTQKWIRTTEIDTTTLGNMPCIRETSDGGFIVAYLSHEIRKLDSFGGLQWVKSLSSQFYIDNDNEFQKTPDGNLILADNYYPLSVSNSRLTKISESGDIIWQKTYSRLTNDFVHAVYPSSDGGYVLVGERQQGTLNNLLIIKTDANGDTRD